ncbi:MAG: hypothetical protein K2M48_07075, partial [Clostridiales bacterium]|nr:hypothetical protein [Clostridiales bacterium]
VCKLCHDGFVETRGDPTDLMMPDDLAIDSISEVPQSSSGKVATLTPEQLEKLLTPSNEERRKLYASLKKSAKSEKELLAADTESLKQDLIETNEEIEAEKRQAKREKPKNTVAQEAPIDKVMNNEVDSATEEAMSKLMGTKST